MVTMHSGIRSLAGLNQVIAEKCATYQVAYESYDTPANTVPSLLSNCGHYLCATTIITSSDIT